MSINGTVINGAAINGTGELTVQPASIQSVAFGGPRVYPPVPASILPVTFGRPYSAATAEAMEPVTFGTPSASATTLARAFSPSRFGLPLLETGWLPGAVVLMAAPLKTSAFGRPSMESTSSKGPISSLAPLRFGTPSTGLGMNATGSVLVSFGAPAMSNALRAPPMTAVAFGLASAGRGTHARPLQRVRFGHHLAELAAADGAPGLLTPVCFGIPRLASIGVRSRAVYAGRFGTPVLDRGTAC